MSDRFSGDDAEREALSALVDGEAQSQEVARACAAWRYQPDAQATWYTYQLIGDAMRSDDLAHAASGDAFLSKFRERLAQEPVVLAPSAAQAAHASPEAMHLPAGGHGLKRRVWAGPLGVAASFVMLVGALMSSTILPGRVGNSVVDTSLAQAGAGMAPVLVGGGSAYVPTQWPSGTGADAGRSQGLSIAGGASFNRPAQALIIRDPSLEQALYPSHGAQPVDASFAGQGELIKQVVFHGR
jgi:sigma-E factor negative regulatory protein RseA